MIVDWDVSSPFEESRLEPIEKLGEEVLADLTWLMAKIEDQTAIQIQSPGTRPD